MSDGGRERLRTLFETRAFARGDFVLASGQRSSYYINSKKAMFHSEAADLLADEFYRLTCDLQVQAVGGLEVGAIPLTALLVARYHRAGESLEGFFVRKAVKDHGSRGRIEGVLPAGARVAILDDVLTTGDSAAQAAAEVERAGGVVVSVVCIVDRLAGAQERLSAYGLRSIFTIRDFGVEPAG
jgi:orotate phosphoribosyltransferase